MRTMSTDNIASRAEQENQFTTTHHVYEPHKAGLPPLQSYIVELWRRREFAAESSRAGLRAANTMTFFGQLWMVLNPLLLAAVYFILVNVLAGGGRGLDFFASLTAGLFMFYFIQSSMSTGAQSVVGGGKLLLNTAFPRLLMPFSAVRSAWYRFLPTVPVYFIFHLWSGRPFSWATLLVFPFIGMIILFSLGLASLFGALQVYFRDTTAFLPYFSRIWLYMSPVLWTIDDLDGKFLAYAKILQAVNPLFSLLGGYKEALVSGTVPPLSVWVGAFLWSTIVFAIGCLFFMSREREFAVRL